jgi:uncharacterized membrane protein
LDCYYYYYYNIQLRLSHHSFLLDLNGAELLLISFVLSAAKTCTIFNPIFFLSFALQVRY